MYLLIDYSQYSCLETFFENSMHCVSFSVKDATELLFPKGLYLDMQEKLVITLSKLSRMDKEGIKRLTNFHFEQSKLPYIIIILPHGCLD